MFINSIEKSRLCFTLGKLRNLQLLAWKQKHL